MRSLFTTFSFDSGLPRCSGCVETSQLRISWTRSGRAKSRQLENLLDDLVVKGIFSDEYSGESFKGYGNICIDFSELEIVFASARPDWKAALENANGVSRIIDKSNGKECQRRPKSSHLGMRT